MQRELRVQLGRVWMPVEDVAALAVGSEIELECLSSDTVDLCVGARRIARGTPAVMDGKLCVRVSDVARSAAPACGNRRAEE